MEQTGQGCKQRQSFLSIPCCGDVSFSQEREKNNSEKLYMEFLCIVLALVLFRLMKLYEFYVMALCHFLFSFDRANQTALTQS